MLTKSLLHRMPGVRLRHKVRALSSWSHFATVDPMTMSSKKIHCVQNLVAGEWYSSENPVIYPDPLNGDEFLAVSEASSNAELAVFAESLNKAPITGLHNPLKNPERYLQYGQVTAAAAHLLDQRDVQENMIRLIQRVAPKSYAQSKGEVVVTQRFLQNFSGDQVRFLTRGFHVPGDHYGQSSSGYRWPYGPVVIISPFNFPLEIPLLQLMGALYMGNKVLLKVDSRVSVVMEQMLRLLHACGMPKTDVDFVNCSGESMQKLLLESKPKMTQFTGSSRVAEVLAKELNGRLKVEDAGWDWKILGPDVSEVDYVAYTCDQDANAYSGQKCSAQSALFIHKNWSSTGLIDKLTTLASNRSYSDLTLGPILSVPNSRFEEHMKKVLAIPGARLLFGGDLVPESTVPACYGSWKPTAVMVPFKEFLKDEHFAVCATEIFGPFQIVVEYGDEDLDALLDKLQCVDAYLTAAVVSNDVHFQNKVLANSVNGTTYCGIRARTTGAPQNHWFGPAGDPRGAGIGTPEAIRLVWSCHREIISDVGPLSADWTTPATT